LRQIQHLRLVHGEFVGFAGVEETVHRPR